jgi:acetyl esterase/lipase
MGSRPLALDIYVPERNEAPPAGPGCPPLLVYVHGGGWREGTNDRPPGFRSILARGFALASLQYRFSHEGSGLDMLADLRRGVQVARAEAASQGADADAWFLWGISAGGHLVSLLAHRLNDPAVVAAASAETASAGGAPQPVGAGGPSSDAIPSPRGVAPWCGVFDLERYSSLAGVGAEHRATVTEIEQSLTGGSREERVGLSPVTYAGPDSPPHLFVHGEEDTLVPPEQSRLMHEALSAAGVRSELILVPGRGHAMPPDDSPEIHRTVDFLLSCARTREDDT